MDIIKNKGNFILGLTLALVFALDILTTQIAISTGVGYEGNPFMRAVIENSLLTILVKGIGLLLIILVVNCYKSKWIGYMGMGIVIGITLIVVINNVIVII